MAKRLITDYQFVAASKTITFPSMITFDGLLIITNVTRNILIYNFTDATVGGSLSGNVLTLVYDTSGSMADGDHLQIWYDDGLVESADSSKVLSIMEHQLLVMKEIRSALILLLNLVDTSGQQSGYDVADLTAHQNEGVQ